MLKAIVLLLSVIGILKYSKNEIKENLVYLESPSSCVTCHQDIARLMSKSKHIHETSTCITCHLGDEKKTDKKLAHIGLIAFPGNLDKANISCGGCHEATVSRVKNSIMNTVGGMIAVNRFAFKDTSSPDIKTSIQELGQKPSDNHFKQLCIECHLSFNRTKHTERKRGDLGGGCMACHYDKNAGHAKISLKINNDNCFGCHSRSSRISLNYEGLSETTFEKAPDLNQYQILHDKRVVKKVPADIHFTKGLVCIDCHTAREVMGDGNTYLHQEDQEEISCEDCHQKTMPSFVLGTDLDDESMRLVINRGGKNANDWQYKKYILSHKKQKPLINLSWNESKLILTLIEKNSITEHLIKPISKQCTEKNHQNLTCQACHSAPVSQCIGCHTEEAPNGKWQESIGNFELDYPVIGFNEKTKKYDTFVPGMIMTIKKDKELKNHLVRMYSRISPHTTTKSRSCKSCHNSSLALGFGRGEINFGKNVNELPRFEFKYDVLEDNLPADAWIVPFSENKNRKATRLTLRPLNKIEQVRILKVGYCLQCHY